jgi:hypothetical protein
MERKRRDKRRRIPAIERRRERLHRHTTYESCTGKKETGRRRSSQSQENEQTKTKEKKRKSPEPKKLAVKGTRCSEIRILLNSRIYFFVCYLKFVFKKINK